MLYTSRSIRILFFNDTATTEIYTLSLHDALPIFVEHAHLQPRFVEDSVRLALQGTLDRYPDLADGDFLFSRQVNLETIHTHDVVPERYRTVGELRREIRRASGRERGQISVVAV